MSKRIPLYYSLPAILLSTLLVAAIIYAAWQPPTAPPPDENVDAPINVGSDSQTKSGSLAVYGLTTTWLTAAGNTLLAVDTGNVGIGTPGPGRKLDVADRIRVRSGAAGTGGIWFADSVGNELSFVGILSETAPDTVGFWNNGWGLVLDNNRNVGIGTTAPGAKLDVNGAARISTYNLGGFEVLNPPGSYARLISNDVAAPVHQAALSVNGWVNTSNGVLQTDDGTVPTWMLVLDATAANDQLKIRRAPAGSTSQGDLATLVTVKSDGNVGIGTTAPGAKLEVAGQVKITGGSPGADKVLTSDASGLASWQTPTGGGGTLTTTVVDCDDLDDQNAGCSVSCPAGYTVSGCSGYGCSMGDKIRAYGAWPSGNGCQCATWTIAGVNASITCYATCAKIE